MALDIANVKLSKVLGPRWHGESGRWHGKISRVHVGPGDTCPEIVKRCPDRSARTIVEDSREGRFLVCRVGSLDLEVV